MGPVTRNRGRPNTDLQSTPESQQQYLPTSTRSVKSKRPPAAKSKSRKNRPQQTITQMPLLHQLYHPELYHADLEYEEARPEVDIENGPLASRSPKRRKITETPSKKGKIGEEVPAKIAVCSPPMGTGHEIQSEAGGGSAVKHIQPMLPPAPTPKRPMRKEIPSSQSPQDTPLSALSRRSSKRETSRSPLKERSMNLQFPVAIAPKGIGRLVPREVADSMETEDEDEDGDALFDSQVDRAIVPEQERLQQKRVDPGGESVTSHIQVKTSFPKEASNESGRTTRVRSVSESPYLKATSRSLEESEESDAGPRKPVNASPQLRSNDRSASHPSNTRVTENVEHVDEPLLGSVQSSPPPQNPDIRLLAAHCPPPLALETDSQFEAVWHTYHSAPIAKPLPPPSPCAKEKSQPSSSQLQYIPSSQPVPSSPPPHPNEEGNASTQPTQSLPNQTLHPPSIPRKPYVPPSQATTTASPTQPQHFTPRDDEPHILVPSSPSPPQPPTPPPPPMFSSPVIGRKSQRSTKHNEDDDDNDADVGGAKKHEWDPQRRVRDSQLLPASFLQDSWFVGPDEIEDGDVGDGEEAWIEEDD